MPKVVVGMSGGVDSSVAAYLLKEQGYEVIGVTMETLKGAAEGIEDARTVAKSLDIPYYVADFTEIFRHRVIDYFIGEYLAGATPNPCIACNRYVKWEALLSKAHELGADYIATGHYARVLTHPVTGRYTLAPADTRAKDQTYVLYSLTQEQLQHTLMPLCEYEKSEIREIAASLGLNVADKPDSQDICFVPDGDYGAFITGNTMVNQPEGDFVDMQGKVLGRHRGILNYTIGQRKGLGIALGVPAYVCEIDVPGNRVVLGSNEDLFKRSATLKDFNWMAYDRPEEGSEIRAMGKLRYSQRMSPCILRIAGDRVEAVFDEPQRAITPGQAGVFYVEDYLMGGGTIEG